MRELFVIVVLLVSCSNNTAYEGYARMLKTGKIIKLTGKDGLDDCYLVKEIDTTEINQISRLKEDIKVR